MTSENRTDARLRTVVLIVSAVCILFFGYRVLSRNPRTTQPNPFAFSVGEYSRSGGDRVAWTEERTIPLALDSPAAIARGADGRLYAAGDGKVLTLDADGIVLATFETGEAVRCLAVDGNGDLYLGFSVHIEVFDGQGRRKASWEPIGDNTILTSLAVGKEKVFAADAGGKIVWEYDKSGQRLRRIGDRDESRDVPGYIIPSPFFDVALDPEGFLWAANTGRFSLENYTPDGGLRTSWGKSSMEIDGFCGCCNPTHFAVFEDGSFVTSEKGIPRIKVTDRLGRLESVVAGPDRFEEGTVGLDLAVDEAGRVYILDPARKSIRIFSRIEGGAPNPR